MTSSDPFALIMKIKIVRLKEKLIKYVGQYRIHRVRFHVHVPPDSIYNTNLVQDS